MIGFSIVDAGGNVLDWREHIEEALPRQRELHAAEDVIRVSDGAVVATKRRVRGEHLYQMIWRMRFEPGWQ